jgi:hypothetical protein
VVSKPKAQRLDLGFVTKGICSAEKTDQRDHWLRPHIERPCDNRATKKRNELSARHPQPAKLRLIDVQCGSAQAWPQRCSCAGILPRRAAG